jgi:hypothetical protein
MAGERQEEQAMEALAGHELARRVGATLGVVGSLALAFFYVLVPALTVPWPANYGFYVAWVGLVVLAIVWWRPYPWRSLAVPIVGLVAVLAALWLGNTYLGWGP